MEPQQEEQHPSLNLLMHRAYPELAAALRARAGAVEQRWQAVVRASLPAADELTFVQVRDDLPVVLEQIARALESDAPDQTRRLSDMAPKHGEVRFDQNFDVGELLFEYNLLRPILVEEVVRQTGRPLQLQEVAVLDASLDLVIRQSVVGFVQHQTRQLQAATEAQSKYLSFLSHDLRGALNGVFLMVEVLKRDLKKEPKYAETVADMERMKRTAFDTIATMDRFLHAERFRKGKVQVKPTRLSVRSLVGELAAQFAYQARDKGLDLQADASDACEMWTDRELVSLILQNLVSNAIKYTPAGTVRLTASAVDGGGCRVAVADQGPGIEPQKMQTLFDPYARGDTHGQPGVGLGLSIARQAADLLKAKLWAESRPGSGSTFFLELPPNPPASPSQLQPSTPAPATPA